MCADAAAREPRQRLLQPAAVRRGVGLAAARAAAARAAAALPEPGPGAPGPRARRAAADLAAHATLYTK